MLRLRVASILLVSLACSHPGARSLPRDAEATTRFLAPGPQSTITDPRLKSEIGSKLKVDYPDIRAIANAFRWKKKHFKGTHQSGLLIGLRDINELYRARSSSGCHDDGLILAAILREMGIPARMVDATSIAWSKTFDPAEPNGFEGHVFVEAYVQGQWILVDSTSGRYAQGYDPDNPVIPFGPGLEPENRALGYYVMRKGLDPWDYGIRNRRELQALQMEFARKIQAMEIQVPMYRMGRL